MSSIGKFTAALAAISQEVTITAANFNLDFTLMKVEAPAEYQPLGRAISLHRRHQAESGSAHTTARKLGALFESIIPYTPTLYKAYGQRASTVIETQTAKGLNDNLIQSGPFSTHAGPDATTIWAAATSGKTAISVHLLACMLARIWKGPEAISVWVELVARRKAEIVQESEQGSIQSTTDLLAEQQEISRSHLAIWDSSARAWLQTADEALCVKQTQLKLVLDNVNIPVENSSDLYTSVIKAWKTALLLVDRLASGSPQSVQDGSVLLGLSAWHMYPDMLVLGKSTVRIEQKDDLIAPGGILTIGLEYSNREGSGLFWSLPLAHMHFYGDTPTVTRSLTTITSRVPVNALFQVALGNLSSQWMVDTTESSDMIAEMHRCLMTGLGIPGASAMKSVQQHNWFAAIHQASIDSINSVGQAKELNEKLHALGARRSHTFLTNVAEKAEKYFDLNQFPKLLSLMKDREAQIGFLRAIGRNLGLEPDDIFVRYRPEKSLKLDKPRPYASKPEWRYASVVPHSFTSLKRSSEGQQKIRQVYCRWFSLPPKPSGDTLASQQYKAHLSALLGAIAERLGESGKPMADIPSISPAQNQLNMIADEPAASMETFIPTTAYNFERYIDDYSFVWQGFGLDTCTGDHNETFRSLGAGHCVQWGRRNQNHEPHVVGDEDDVEFKFLLGDLDHAAIFVRQDRLPRRFVARGYGSPATTEEIKIAFQSGIIDPFKLDRYLSEQWGFLDSSFVDSRLSFSLRILSCVKSIYDNLADSTVDLSVISRPLCEARWVKSLETRWVKSLETRGSIPPLSTMAEAFSCIAMFDSGNFDIDPYHLEGVIALSTGNSLYIASCLASSPSKSRAGTKIERILGNLGRPEMAFLFACTSKPAQKSFDYNNWELITHAKFDGTCQDCFQATTLHLSFTDYEQTVDVGRRGIKDTEVVLIESVVSVHDRGKWISDIDIIKSLSSDKFLVAVMPPCDHSEQEKKYSEDKAVERIVSIDNWEELLDAVEDATAIVRAHDNWLARLAATAISIQNKRKTIVLPSEICWECLRKSDIYNGKTLIC